jgi:hypothetical protein
MFASTFPVLCQNLALDNESIWEEFARSDTPERAIPSSINSRITAFQRCLIMQVCRPDRLETAMHEFVKEAFGGKNVQPSAFDLKTLYQTETTNTDPILFIISPGSDPSAEL